MRTAKRSPIETTPPARRKEDEMTPKQQYDARKAERDKLKDMDHMVRERTSTLMMLDMLDRFVIAAERIADALEPSRTMATSSLVPDPNSASGFKVANTFGNQ